MYKPIAIIGCSYSLPKIQGWKDLVLSLKEKNTFINHLSRNRLSDIENRFGKVEMSKGGYLENIDLFDPEYFGISKRDAVKMTPEQRYFLMHGLRAFYDAGYSEKYLRGSNTGIFFTAARSSYTRFLDGQKNDFNRVHGMEGTRIANFLDLRGPAISIDTSCSSSLVALHQACLSLQNEDCNMALIGGVKFSATTKQTVLSNIVMSNKEACRPFDESADGILNGEGAICVILKTLDKAEKDNDPIYGVIESSAVNHGGARIASLTAPNSEAQKEVLLKAWDKGGIKASEIEYIEAHGTGTILGDPIEFEGIQRAFKERTDGNATCSVSSFKGLIGHLDFISGLAGVLRLLAALQSNLKPLQPNLTKINKLIDETKGIIKVQRKAEVWKLKDESRTGGVNSFGLTGTNAHVVVSSYTPLVATLISEEDIHFLQIGATTKDRLTDLKEYLGQYLQGNEISNLSSFARTVNRLYTSNDYCQAFIFSSKEGLAQKLNSPINTEKINTDYFLLDLDVQHYNASSIQDLFIENDKLRTTWRQQIGVEIMPETIHDDNVLSVLFQYVVYKYLLNVLDNKIQIVTKKGNGILQDLLNKRVSTAQLIENPELIIKSDSSFEYNNFVRFLKQRQSEKIVIVNFSNEESSGLTNPAWDVLNFNNKVHRFALYKNLLENKAFPLAVKNSAIRNLDLKLPVFNLNRFWPESIQLQPSSIKAEVVNESAINNNRQSIRVKLEGIWKDLLDIDEDINDTDDFFDLGGSSLEGLDMLTELEKEYKTSVLGYEEMFSFSTLESLTNVLFERLNAQQSDGVEKKEPKVEENQPNSTDRDNAYQELIQTIGQRGEANKIGFKDILVTGATGLLGAFVVNSLLSKTSANIICLVRGGDWKEASNRFWKNFENAFGIKNNERIKIINGDLINPMLSLEATVLGQLKEVDLVYHIAGSPSFAGKPNLRENINFLGTKNVFDWCETHKVKHFNFISTIGVMGQKMPEHILRFYETDLNLGQSTTNYIHSGTKLMAEEYIRKSSKELNVNVFRIPNIGGDFSSGYIPAKNLEKNLMYSKLKTVIEIGMYSDEFEEYDLGLKLVPVDKMSNVIVDLSLIENNDFNTFHLLFEKGFSMKEIINALSKNGFQLRKVDHSEFLNQIENLHKNSDNLLLKLDKSSSYDKISRKVRLNSELTKTYLNKLGIPWEYARLEYLSKIVQFYLERNQVKV